MKKLLLILILLTGFTTAHAQTDEPRSFLLGFTPFPYDVTVEAVMYTYERLAADADLTVQHFDNGVPWTEALANQPYNPQLMEDWSWRRTLTPADQSLLVTVTPLAFLRDGLAAYHGETDNMPVPAPFDTYPLDHPDVIAAYIQYCDTIIEYFQPDYFMFGIEVNLLMKSAPQLWDSYMVLHRAVYTHLKERYPDLPAFVSLTGIDVAEGYTDANHADQLRVLDDLHDYTDLIGWSIYPYFTNYLTTAIPTDLFNDLAALTDKPQAVTETGYPAQDFAINFAGVRLEFDTDPTKQALWMQYLLASAQEHDLEFVVNFVLRDYDAVWRWLGSREELEIAWRDTGLYDEDGGERPALAVWREWLARPFAPGS